MEGSEKMDGYRGKRREEENASGSMFVFMSRCRCAWLNYPTDPSYAP